MKTVNHKNKHFCIFFLGITTVALTLYTASVQPCSTVLMQGAPWDHVVVSARTMDFEVDLRSQFVIVSQQQDWTSNSFTGDNKLSWSNKYGFVGINASLIGLNDKFVDGINEHGLSAALLWLNETKLPTAPNPGETRKDLSVLDVVSYTLGQCKTVSEARKALTGLRVWGEKASLLGNEINPTLHLFIADAYGESMVVEWINGKQHIYDQSNIEKYPNALTNSPPYPKQITGFSPYANLSCKDYDKGKLMPGLKLLPGGPDSPSRFARLVKISQCAQSGSNPNIKPYPYRLTKDNAVTAAFQVIGNLEIPPGERVYRTPDPATGLDVDWTQWTLVRVHGEIDPQTHRSTSKLFVRSSQNASLRLIDLEQIDFTLPKPVNGFVRKPIDDPAYTKGETIPLD